MLISENGLIYPPLARCLTPMLLTGIDLDGYGHSVRSWDGAYFGDGRNFSDLVTFWNLRAAGNNIVFAPLAELPRYEEFIKVHFGHLDQQPDRHPNIPDHIHFSFNRTFVNSHDKINVITKLFPTKKQHAVNFCDEVNWNGLNVEPVMFHFVSENAPALIEREGEGYNVTITLPPKSFLSKSERYNGNQQMAFSLAPVGSFAHPDHTLDPPFRPELNEFYSRQMSFDPWKIRSEKEGIGILGNVDEKIISLKPIRETEVIKALLGLAGVNIKPSQGGRLADRLIEKLDGLNGSRIFKIRGVRSLIARLNSQTAIGRGEAAKEIWNDGQLKANGGLYIKGRKCEEPNLVFDMLLQNEFFRAGLELKCDHCGLENWLSLRQIDDIWVCEYCGHKNTTSLHIRNRGDWKFRKSGLLAKDNNQEGAIPVLLSLLVFERILRREKILHITSVNIEGKAPCEIDFMAVSYSDDRHEYKMEWALGEAKSEGGVINQNDANNLKGVANKIKNIGIKPYLVFTKTADSFNADEIALFKALHKEGHSLILLTNKEMEANFVIYGERKNGEKLPKQFAHTFGDMALNSEYRYLRENPPVTPPAVPPVASGS